MKIVYLNEQSERWLSRALCRRYAAVVFSTLSAPVPTNQLAKDRTICWAFGCLVKGESEILGAWDLDAWPASMDEVFGDLNNRGVEFLRCGLGSPGSIEAAFLATFRMGAAYPSIEQTLADFLDKVRPYHRPAMARLLRATIDDPLADPATVASLRFSSEDLRQKYPGILEQWRESASGFQPLFSLPEPYRQLARSVDRDAIAMQERLRKVIHRHGPFDDSAQAFDFVVDWLMRADLRLMHAARAPGLARVPWVSQCGRVAQVSGGAAGTPALA